MTFSPKRAASQLAKLLRRHGLDCEEDRSGLSSSRYLTVYKVDDDDAPAPIKVRLATHDARPTYEDMNGRADYEIGTHQTAWLDGNGEHTWAAAANILSAFDIKPDKRFAALIAKKEAAKAEEARQAAIKQARYIEFQARQRHVDAVARFRCIAAGDDWDRSARHGGTDIRNRYREPVWRELAEAAAAYL